MKILLVHPEDNPEKGPWTNLAWDHIVDIGLGGENTYERWSRQFHCPVTTLRSFRNGFDDLRHIRRMMTVGCGRLIDEYGLDWWEILSILLTEEVEAALLLQRFAATVDSNDTVHVSRPGLHADFLRWLMGDRAKAFPLRRNARKSALAHYARVFKRLSAAQSIDVFWDKYDPGYQLRGRLTRKRHPSLRPVVLLPTAYVNVSRTGIAYANTFPEESFLLVATRRSGWIKNLPPNVDAAWLSSYASMRDRSDESAEMKTRWLSLLKELQGIREFDALNRLGSLDNFPERLRHGFEVRDAWRNVFDTEPVEGVLCADDSNPYTRIPLLLGQARGLPNIACHHGALDGRYVFKRSQADVIWVKGEMEKDYLLRRCEVPAERIEIAAPVLSATCGRQRPSWQSRRPNEFRPNIVFISEPFEAGGGRAEEIYRDVLPPLADLALDTRRRLIVKLHPAESESERTCMLDRVLSCEQKGVASIVTCPLTEDLFSSAWFGVTIISTVAVECAIRGIPCFLCSWLESLPYEYAEQFIRFGVGIKLNDQSAIRKIPDYLQLHPTCEAVGENCWNTVPTERLRELLNSPYRADHEHAFEVSSK